MMSTNRPPQHAIADRAVNAFERHILDLGWVWNPTRSGSDYGIDGFISPTDDVGKVLSFEIPIQVKGVGRLLRHGPVVVANPVTRDAVDILRTHVLSGYFMVYDDASTTMYYCSADAIGKEFDSTGAKSKRLRIPLENVVGKESLLALRNNAIAAHAVLVETLGQHSVRDVAQKLYLALTKVQPALFEFVAAIGLFDQGNLMRIYSRWGDGLARQRQNLPDNQLDSSIDEYLDSVSAVLSEYQIAPREQLLSNFPGASLVLTIMLWIVQEIDAFVDSMHAADHPELVDDIGLSGLRSMLRAAVDRSFSAGDGAPLPDKVEPGISVLVIKSGHYFLSTVQVALVVNRLMYELLGVVFPSNRPDGLHAPPPSVWIWHRSDEQSFFAVKKRGLASTAE